MTIGNEDELEKLKAAGALVARTLQATGGEPTVQYEHILVATRNGPLVLTPA
jgi:methionine aminopeptidase